MISKPTIAFEDAPDSKDNQSLAPNLDRLLDLWIEDYERQTFNGQTLDELLKSLKDPNKPY